jgi:hypothetical protein
MKEKVRTNDAIDVSIFPRFDGCYVLPDHLDIEDVDLCDARIEQWVWSVGKMKDGRRLASLDARFYPSTDEYECVWLR